jgi:hypothetical protein
VAQYVGGLVLCLVVSFVYSLARKDTPRAVLRETAVVFVYTLGAIAAVVLVVFFACKFK